jgi:hypothetical protein
MPRFGILFQCFSFRTIESSNDCRLEGYFHGFLTVLFRKFNKTHERIQNMDRVETENEIKIRFTIIKKNISNGKT